MTLVGKVISGGNGLNLNKNKPCDVVGTGLVGIEGRLQDVARGLMRAVKGRPVGS